MRIVQTVILWLLCGVPSASSHHVAVDSVIRIKPVSDFSITGDGTASGWSNAPWTDLAVQEGVSTLSTRVKVLYSQKGVYFLFECADEKLTATITEDNRALFREDVVEVFLWPDQSVPIYFEYELSPLNYELFMMVPNINGKFQGWKPWYYEGEKRVKHATAVKGEKRSNAFIRSWTAEFFIPFDLLRPMVSGMPEAGTTWRGNFYRIDYDHGYTTWSWQKTTKGVDGNFHEFKKFGRMIFE
ncbi:MAG TPA: carbohydrate-binding family 9-like protein [Ohtaekwangia sp.]|nr:carbohydrate-binding family 9-like protein [Ohtaekwangia sp.]